MTLALRVTALLFALALGQAPLLAQSATFAARVDFAGNFALELNYYTPDWQLGPLLLYGVVTGRLSRFYEQTEAGFVAGTGLRWASEALVFDLSVRAKTAFGAVTKLTPEVALIVAIPLGQPP